MRVTTAVKEQLLTSADALLLQKAALAGGMIPLRREGALLAISGKTSSGEVLRVSRGCEEG
jgi:type II secretory ATPase GspE/PulE/Tfp pilus assembly ATPase PilB-like protein